MMRLGWTAMRHGTRTSYPLVRPHSGPCRAERGERETGKPPRTLRGIKGRALGCLIGVVALGVGVSAGSALAQDARKLVAPMRGEATVEITAPNTRPVGTDIVTTIRVRNSSKAPIAGFRIEENWYKGNEAISGDSYRHRTPLQPGEVIEVKLTTPRARIVGARNQYQFSHANGTVKPTTVKSLDLPKPTK